MKYKKKNSFIKLLDKNNQDYNIVIQVQYKKDIIIIQVLQTIYKNIIYKKLLKNMPKNL